MVEVPTTIIIVFIIMIVLSIIGIACCVIDTAIKIDEHNKFVQDWGELHDEKSTLGSSEE